MGLNASSRGHRDSSQAREPIAGRASAVVWHDLECGSYGADLPLWRELADGADTVLDVGAGTGRVTLDLARSGHRVTALDLDAELLGALQARVAALRLAQRVRSVCADARTFALERRDFQLCIAPMQTLQLLEGAPGRLAFLERARAHLRAGGLLACAIVTEVEPFDCASGDTGPAPESVRKDGSRFLSRATRVHVGEAVVRIERERAIVDGGPNRASAQPTWELDVVELDRVSVDELEREGREAGLTPAGARTIAATYEHTGSVAVMFRA